MDDNTNATYDDVDLTAANDYTAQERAALVTYQLSRGARMSTAEIAGRAGVTVQGAHYIMERLSRVTPVTFENGQWHMTD